MLVLSGILTLAACGGRGSGRAPLGIEPVVVREISGASLANLTYTLTDPLVRERLMANGKTFSVTLRHGSAALLPADRRFGRVTLLQGRTVYGDVTGDGREDAVVVLRVGEETPGILELAIVTEDAKGPMHFASYDLGQAELQSLRVQNGKIFVNIAQQVPGDPGPRNTALTLEVPANGTGATKMTKSQ